MDELFAPFNALLQLFQVGQSPQTFLVLAGLAFARCVAFVSIVPFFGGSAVPRQVKVATAVSFVLVVYPALAASLPPGGTLNFGPIGYLLLLLKEVCIGFTLGYVVSLIFEAVQVAGRIIDTQRGASMGETLAPQLQLQVSEIGQLKLQFAIVLFLALGAHRFFIRGLFQSFEVLPALTFPKLPPGFSPLLEHVVNLSGQSLVISVQLAGPVIVTLFLTDVFFGLLNRIAPQINVFFLSMPFKMMIGLLIVLLAFPLYQERYIYYFKQSIADFERLLSIAPKQLQPPPASGGGAATPKPAPAPAKN
jgi:flagellar biosynthetic protein FliR